MPNHNCCRACGEIFETERGFADYCPDCNMSEARTRRKDYQKNYQKERIELLDELNMCRRCGKQKCFSDKKYCPKCGAQMDGG